MRISDWSSDVCSSDLRLRGIDAFLDRRAAFHQFAHRLRREMRRRARGIAHRRVDRVALPRQPRCFGLQFAQPLAQRLAGRTEERRVGKEWVSKGRSRWLPATKTKIKK